MSKSNAKKSKQATQAYSVILDGSPVVVQAASTDEAVETAKAQVGKKTDGEGDVS